MRLSRDYVGQLVASATGRRCRSPLVDPTKIGEIADAMVALSEDAELAASLSRKALLKAGHFSWKQTAESTRQAYLEALDGRRGAAVAVAGRAPPDPEELERAVRRTVDYATRFDYPLSVPELARTTFRGPNRRRDSAGGNHPHGVGNRRRIPVG